MTTSSATASPLSVPRSARRVAGRQSLGRAIRSEWIKLRTLRSTWITSAITVLLTSGIGTIACIEVSDPTYMGAEGWKMAIIGTTFGQIVVAVLGALVITGEYSSGQIRSTLAAVPRRSRAFTAKAIVIAAWSFLMGALSILLVWALSTPFVGGRAVALTNTSFLGYVWGTGLAYAAIALMSLGLGFLFRSTAGSITMVTVLMFVINIPLTIAASFWEWAGKVVNFTPAVVVTSVIDPHQVQSSWAPTDPSMILTHPQAVLVFAAWVLVPLVAGWLAFTRRDA